MVKGSQTPIFRMVKTRITDIQLPVDRHSGSQTPTFPLEKPGSQTPTVPLARTLTADTHLPLVKTPEYRTEHRAPTNGVGRREAPTFRTAQYA
jgi:hypothetical protein